VLCLLGKPENNYFDKEVSTFLGEGGEGSSSRKAIKSPAMP